MENIKIKKEINYRNLIISLILSGICGIIYGITFNKIIPYIPFETSFIVIFGCFLLAIIGIITLFPIFEKEIKNKKKKQSAFDTALKNKMR